MTTEPFHTPRVAIRPQASPKSITGTAIRDAATGVVKLWKAVRKHWSVVGAVVVLVTGGTLLYSKSLTKIYEASTLIEIRPNAMQPLGDDSHSALSLGAGFSWDDHEYYETQYKIIGSDRVLGAAVRDLALTNDASFMGFDKQPAKPATVEDAIGILRGHVNVEPIKYSYLVHVKVEDSDPKRARRISEAVAEAYIEQNLQTALNATSDAVVWLNSQLDTVKGQLEHDENALYEFKRSNDLPSTSINESSNMLRLEMQELDTALTHTRTRKQEILAREQELSRVSSDSPDQLPASELLASGFLQSLRTQFQDALRDRQSLLAEGKGESHPLVKRASERLTETRSALLAEVRNIQGSVERDLAVVTHEEEGEAALFEATRKRAVDLNMKEIEYHRLDRTRDQNEKLFGLLLQRTKEADLARMMRVNNIRVVDAAGEPASPIRPRVMVNTTVGLVVGLLLGIALAWVREQLDTSLKTPDDVEESLRLTFLGLLPEVEEGAVPSTRRRRRRGSRAGDALLPIELIVHERPMSGIAEAARSIRTNLMFMNPDRPHRRLLVTSAAPAEGKTTVACSMAIALAQGGQRVCIVDCDLRKPRLHRIFDRAGDAGVTNVLVGDATIDEVVKPTAIANLWSIPAGPMPPNPADMLHSERFRRFLEELSERFDRVVIDSPPLVAVTDAAVLSTLVDGTVFVVRAFKTSKHLANHGLRALRDVDAHVVGVVLNAVNLNRHEYSYYSYYYYKRDGYRPIEERATMPSSTTEGEALPPN